MADLTFYTNPQSRGRIVRWMLEEVGQPYETQIISYDEMKGERYRAINPMGKVPAIKHRGHVVTEGAAICTYLADAFPEAMLGPKAEEKADYFRWLFYAAGPVEQAVTNHFAKWEPAPDQVRMFGYGNFETVVSVLDESAELARLCVRRPIYRRRRLFRLPDHVSAAVRDASGTRQLFEVPRPLAGARCLQTCERRSTRRSSPRPRPSRPCRSRPEGGRCRFG